MHPIRTKRTLDLLRRYESRNITFQDETIPWPIVWERSRGCHVWDVEGRKYLDLTAAFGVCAAGHGHPRVVRAGQKQMAQLQHAMGDVHPHPLKANLARELSRITFERWSGKRHSAPQTGKTIFCNSGFEAVEAALKTALLATGRPGIIAFQGGYHGLGYGALNATHRNHFRGQFQSQIKDFGSFVPYPANAEVLGAIERAILSLARRNPIGAILVEPVQGRGGINVPPHEFLPMLRRLSDEIGALLIIDEILTGFGRTGKWFACEHSETLPDLICLGKALTGGFPLSACVGRIDWMDRAWPASKGEAIHTSTFLGHPVGCAMALEQMKVLREEKLVARSARLGRILLRRLRDMKPPADLVLRAKGLGLMAGLEIRYPNGEPATSAALQYMSKILHQGVIILPEGEHAATLSFTPSLTIPEKELGKALDLLQKLFDKSPAKRQSV
ncbi:MAG: aspartate aminotransferase family protein [Verrucomicrobia bacterium]|nr:aspartate aminotransferase family protein [Verrucomicrobiota bacterium]